MKYKKILNTDLLSSEVVLGCDGLGSTLDKNESIALLDEYTRLGGNHLDTARIYGYPSQESEKLIGKWLKERGNRHNVIITTKGAHPEPSTMHISRLSAEELGSDIENSLINLKTDYIDLYLLHRDDEKVPVAGIIEALNKYVNEGKIREIGASNWTAARIAEANAYAKKHGLKGFRASQIKWSYAVVSDSYGEDPTLVAMDTKEHEAYKNMDLSVFAYASQAKGFFSKYAEGGEIALSTKAKERYLCDENLHRFELAKQIADKNSVSIGTVILCYILSQTIRAFPVVGCKNVAQLRDSLAASETVIAAEDIKRIVETGNHF